uniref:Microtubule-associated protein 6a n=2 Tax=Latimeria chalumnae TaxID=7897 RepID=M3XI44_LATCH
MRQDYKHWKVRPEPSCKPKSEYQPSEVPFEKETQYQKDFKPWPVHKRGDHPWIPKAAPATPTVAASAAGSAEKGQEKVAKAATGEKAPESADGEEKGAESDKEPKQAKVAPEAEQKEKKSVKAEGQPVPPPIKGRAVADALNKQIKEEVVTGTSYRNEFRPWTDVKPVKPIKAKPQFKPPEERVVHETSYKAMFKGEFSRPAEPMKPMSADNKAMERRRIRTLYSEPYREPPKVEKPSAPSSKPKKNAPSHKAVKKAKDKQISSGRAAKKKAGESAAAAKPEDKEKNKKEMNNKLAEAKE